MKKRILALAMVLAMLAVLAIPMAAFAETEVTNTGTGTVSSTGSISITAPGNFAFGTFSAGDNDAASSTNGTVTYSQGNSNGWQVTAKDNNTSANTGCMLRTTDSNPLTSKLQISGTGAAPYSPADTGIKYTGTASGEYTFNAEQNIASSDKAGDYAITIKFVGSLTF